MKNLFASSVVAVVALTLLCASQSASAVILVNVCNDTLRCHGDTCKLYVVPTDSCFSHISGFSLKMKCEQFETCVNGDEYLGNSCGGSYGRNYTLPANECLGDRYNLLTKEGNISSYHCAGSTDCFGGDVSKCQKFFGPETLGTCVTTSPSHGLYNFSLGLHTATSSCNEIKTEAFPNSNCVAPASHSPGPIPTRPQEAAREANVQGIQAIAAIPSPSPHPGVPGHHHGSGTHGHYHQHQGTIYVSEGKCLPLEEHHMSVLFDCSLHHLVSEKRMSVEDIPVAPESILQLLGQKMQNLGHKRGHKSHPYKA